MSYIINNDEIFPNYPTSYVIYKITSFNTILSTMNMYKLQTNVTTNRQTSHKNNLQTMFKNKEMEKTTKMKTLWIENVTYKNRQPRIKQSPIHI